MTCTANAAPVSSSPEAGSHAITYWPSGSGGAQISHGPTPPVALTAVGTSTVPLLVLRGGVDTDVSRVTTGSGSSAALRIAFWISTPPNTVWPLARNASSGKLGYS